MIKIHYINMKYPNETHYIYVNKSTHTHNPPLKTCSQNFGQVLARVRLGGESAILPISLGGRFSQIFIFVL